MRVKAIELHHFKRFREKKLAFHDEETGLAKDLVVLIGENGAGKSTILQAIAAMLGTTTGRLTGPTELEWPGFSLELVNNGWQSPYEVVLTVEFDKDEIEATSDFFQLLSAPRASDTRWVPPAHERFVEVRLKDGWVLAKTQGEYFQFRGREYARQIVRTHPDGYDIFRRVGQVFWYTEQRTSTSLTAQDIQRPLQLNLPMLRQKLADWYNFHFMIESGKRPLRRGERDIYDALQKAYATVFPNRRMDGPVPRADIDAVMEPPWFYFTDGNLRYELAELSGGERAILPLLIDFANWNINHSVILIDEIELHLHPPMQQALVRALRRLGDGNQFIITTHSDAVVDILPEASIFRITD